MLHIRTAAQEDCRAVETFYDAVIDALAESPYAPGWKKDVYPTREYLQEAIRNGQMVVGETDGRIVSCMVVNQEHHENYRFVTWAVEADDAELLVIHTLGVLPAYTGRGIAKEMVRSVIRMARSRGMKAVRMDVFAGNLPAERAYTAIGFRHRGTVPIFYEDTGTANYGLYEFVIE